MFESISESIRKQPRQSAVEQSFQRKEGKTALNTHWWLVFPSEVLVIWTIIPKHKVVDWGLEQFHQVGEDRPKRPKHDREEGKTKRIAQNEAVICPWAICQFLSLSQAETEKPSKKYSKATRAWSHNFSSSSVLQRQKLEFMTHQDQQG